MVGTALRALRRLVPVASLSVLVACSLSPSLDSANSHAPNLSGRWVLDRQVSDDVRARLAPLFASKERRWQKSERLLEDTIPQESPTAVTVQGPPQVASTQSSNDVAGGSNLQWLQRQRQREALVIIAMLSPANQIEIKQAPRELRFSTDKGEGSRTLVPGESSSLFVAVGGFKVKSGWDDATFAIDSRGTGDNETHVVERYTLIESDAQLELRLVARVPMLGKQSFRFVYRRG